MLKTLKLENFRNHSSFDLELHKTTVLVGPNGIGKTNVLESLALTSFGRSFRQDDKKTLVHEDKNYARVVADELEVYIERSPRLKMLVREKGAGRRLSAFIGALPTVIFSPETIDIITGAPKERRRFLDIMISQVDRDYLLALSSYTKVRRQRNKLLQAILEGESSEEELDFWDKELAEHGDVIVERRREAVEFLNENAPKYYKKISGKDQDFRVDYDDKSGGDVIAKLREKRRQEIARGTTIFGPHRDDLKFILDSRDMSDFASRGELRSAILALKVAELNFLEKGLEKRAKFRENLYSPLLLLDDIFSEFDETRRSHLAELILNYQSLITTTDESYLSDELKSQAKIVRLDG